MVPPRLGNAPSLSRKVSRLRHTKKTVRDLILEKKEASRKDCPVGAKPKQLHSTQSLPPVTE